MPKSRQSRVTLPRLNANVITTIIAVMTVTARRVSTSPGRPGRSCSGAGGREVRTVCSSLWCGSLRAGGSRLPGRGGSTGRQRVSVEGQAAQQQGRLRGALRECTQLVVGLGVGGEVA